MSLEIAKLEKARELHGGIVQARCPACAEGGHDRTGEHLRIYPDGRFGCCVHPKDSEHRKRIWALVGCKTGGAATGKFTLRIKVLAHGHHSASTPARSVKAALNAFDTVPITPNLDSRTPRTPKVKLRAHTREDCSTTNIEEGNILEQLKDSESAVRAVLTGERLPFLTADGTLSIPFDSPERYHWWKPDGERMTIAETLREVKERIKHAVTI